MHKKRPTLKQKNTTLPKKSHLHTRTKAKRNQFQTRKKTNPKKSKQAIKINQRSTKHITSEASNKNETIKKSNRTQKNPLQAKQAMKMR